MKALEIHLLWAYWHLPAWVQRFREARRRLHSASADDRLGGSVGANGHD